MNRTVAATIAALTLLAPLHVRAADAADALKQHQTFAGWHAGDGTVSSVVYDGVVRSSGASDPVARIHLVRRGLAYRKTSTSVKYGTISNSGFTGRVFWMSNRNGFIHPVLGDAEKYEISSELIFTEGFAYLGGAQSKGTKTISGTACNVVEVKADASFPIDACIGPDGALVQAVIDPGGSYETAINDITYQTSGTKRFISGWRYDQEKETYQWTAITPNAAVSDSDLHPPAQSATWAFGSGQPVPIDFEHSDTARGIYVEATINGVRGRFLLDTGAGGIALNRSFTTNLHLKPMYASHASGVTGLTNTQIQRVDTITVGDNTLSNVIVSTLDHDLFGGSENGKRVDGIIGFDLFGGALVNLDLDNRQLTMYDPAAMHLDVKNGVELSVDLDTLQPMIPMQVNGRIPIRAVLDTGDLASRGILLSSGMVLKNGLTMLSIHRQAMSGVGAGVSVVRCGALDSLSVGPIVYQLAPACEGAGSDDNSALVGFDFLQHFNMLFDYPEGKLILIPRTDS